MKVKKQKKLPTARIAGLPKCKPISVGCPSGARYMTPLPLIALNMTLLG